MKTYIERIREKAKDLWENQRKKVLWGGAIILILLIIIISGGGNGDELTEETRVDRGDVERVVQITGEVEPVQSVELGFESSGRIQSVNVAVGHEVVEGQVLATLESDGLYADLRDAEAYLDITLAESDATNVDVASAEADLARTKKEQQVLVDNAYRKLLTSELSAYATENEDELETPSVSGFYTGKEEITYIITASEESFVYGGPEFGHEDIIPGAPTPFGSYGLFLQFDDDLDYTETRWVIPIPNTRSNSYGSNLNAYTSALETKEQEVEAAEEELERIQAEQSSGGGRNSLASAKIKQAEARRDAVRARIAERIIRAPFSGTITAVEFEKGEAVNTNTPVISLISSNIFEVTVDVPEIDIIAMSEGNNAEIILEAEESPRVLEGKVALINPAETLIDGASYYETTIEFLNKELDLRSGLTAVVDIETNKREDVLRIPLRFVREENDKFFVTLKKPSGSESEVEVELGLRGSDSMVEVQSGVSEGQTLTRTYKADEE